MSEEPNAVAVVDSAPVQASALAEKIISLASTPGLNPEMFDRLVEWQKREEAAQAEVRDGLIVRSLKSLGSVVGRGALGLGKSVFSGLRGANNVFGLLFCKPVHCHSPVAGKITKMGPEFPPARTWHPY